jgi:rRNA maturation RNase YbeY
MPMGNVFFHYADKKMHTNNIRAIKISIAKIFEREKVSLSRIDYVFCSDEYLFRINKKFLHHTTYTDVISFSLNRPNTPVIGEVYISLDRIKANSKEYNVLFRQELLRVIIHGALHLCGYKDKRKNEEEIMRSKENEYMNLFKNNLFVFHVKHLRP